MASEDDREIRWADPTSAAAGAAPLAAAQVAAWREAGFVLVDGVLPQALLERARADAEAIFPAPGSPEADATRDFGSDGRMTFPSASDAVNAITLHPRLLAAVAQLLGVPVMELRLTQSDLWPKYGHPRSGAERDNADQRIHVDYPNHTLVHPPRWDRPEAVEIILYLSDVSETGGATAVVPRRGADDPAYPWPITRTPGVGALEYHNDRESAEAYLEREDPEAARFRRTHLYPREVRARFGFGSLLLYRHDTWHRGTPLRPGARRIAHNLTFRSAASEWISTLHAGWAWGMYRPGLPVERLLAAASVEQRCVLGFPAPGHPYWTPETVAAVEARYGPQGMDVAPYRVGLP
ncbi:MAG: hypothetical protein HKP30_13775 [Myxococcales bacterium]|nr:hypothetical protein [Myxococcales bacterium]